MNPPIIPSLPALRRYSILVLLIGCSASCDKGPTSSKDERRPVRVSSANGRNSESRSENTASLGSQASEKKLSEAKVLEIVGKLKSPIGANDRDQLIRLMKELADSDTALMNKLIMSGPAETVVSILGKDTDFNAYICANHEKVMELLDSTPWKTSNCGDVKRLATAMAVVHPREVISWLSKKETTPFLDDMVRGVFSATALRKDQNPEELLSILDGSGSRVPALRGMAEILGATDFQHMVKILDSEEASTRSEVLPSLVKYMSIEHPSEAWNYVNASKDIYEDSVLAECAQTIGSRYLLKDRISALRWIESLDNDVVRAGAVAGLLKSWSANDIVAASAWLSTQPLGPARDAGAQVLISQIKDTDPEMAEQWQKTLVPELGK